MYTLVKIAALPIFIVGWFKRHTTVFRVNVAILLSTATVYLLFDLQGTVAFLGLALNLIFTLAFAILQFVAIFWFMAQTKTEVILPGDKRAITWADYRGSPHLVELGKQWDKLLSGHKKFEEMGGRMLTGLLLTGPPGTGKTWFAKAWSGSSGVAFISIEGSGFRAMFWGVDVLKMIAFISKARKMAKKYGACIAYIDEIDAVGMSRGGVQGGRDQVQTGWGGMMGMSGTGALTRLLYEMDGMTEPDPWIAAQNFWLRLLGMPLKDRGKVLFLAATNRPGVLDPALTRPGRFDRTVQVGLPDKSSRRDIINYYLNTITHDEIDVELIVQDTAWATPAKIMAALTKDAVRLAVFDGVGAVTQRHIEDAFQECEMGLENPIADLEPEQRKQIAYHEAGHAVAQYHLRKDLRIVRVSIVRRADALGYVMPVATTDIYAHALDVYGKQIMVCLAGHVASELIFGEPWTGAGADLLHVRQLIRVLIGYGQFGAFPMDDILSKDLQNDVNQYLKMLLSKTRALLEANQPQLEALAEALLEKGDLTGVEAVAIIEGAMQ